MLGGVPHNKSKAKTKRSDGKKYLKRNKVEYPTSKT
jgi:hypothetical protein